MIHAEDIATHRLRTIGPNATLRQAALVMEESNVGFLPVVQDNKAVGVITDRDIAIRGMHQQSALEPTVREVMTQKIVCVQDTATVEEVAKIMGENRVRRVLVNDHAGGLLGVISLDDLAVWTKGDETAGQVLRKIAVGTPIKISPHNGAKPITDVYQPIEEIC